MSAPEKLLRFAAGFELIWPSRAPNWKAHARITPYWSPLLEPRVAEPRHVCRQRPRWLTRTVIKC